MENVIIKTNKRRKRYSLEINQMGNIIVKTPIKPSQRNIDKLLTQYHEWIKNQQVKVIEKRKILSDWVNDEYIYLKGKKYHRFSANCSAPIFEKNRVHVPEKMSNETFLNKMADNYLPERCTDISELMKVNISKITIKKMKSCWGTCSRKNVITLNSALIKVPQWVSDYVMIHECAHIIHFDHSKKFWELVCNYCPEYKDAKNWLKNHQCVLVNR